MKNLVVAFILLIVFAGCHPQSEPETKGQTITILWAKWAPADYLQKLSKAFTKETGIKVVVKQISWDNFYEVMLKAAREKSLDYDLVGGDSQWLGRGAKEDIYVNLTQWVKSHNVDRQMAAASISGYSEYPKGSAHYWAVPLEGDAMGFAYRKDLFEDPKERESFKKRYGYDLAVPSTWAQLKDIAEFFYRPDQDFYGINIWGSEQYDGITMGMQTLIWAYGGDLGNLDSYKVRGILNVHESVTALEMYKTIHAFGAPQWKDSYLEVNEALIQGKVAMVMSYFAFFPELTDLRRNPYAEKTGFFANPAGPKGRFSSMGGQGLSIFSFSKKKELALQFLEWFIRPDVQQQWARLGGYSCDKAVLNSDEFLSASPYNRALSESMTMVRDFWVVPEYLDLLAVSQNYWHQYLIHGSLSSQEALDNTAREWENIFEANGYYKE